MRLTSSEAAAMAAAFDAAWQDVSIPANQYCMAVREELKRLREGHLCAPFKALVDCFKELPMDFVLGKPSLLDIGASGGYYSEVLKTERFPVDYTGMDFSKTFKQFAEQLYPGIRFDVGDARHLPYSARQFDIVLSGAVLMHVFEYEEAIKEAIRVSNRYVLFHRTPVISGGLPTAFYSKEAYGVRCLEIHFGQRELVGLFSKHGLLIRHIADVFVDGDFGHVSYLLEKM